MVQQVRLDLLIPNHTQSILNAVQSTLEGITRAASEVDASWKNMLGHVSTFNTVASAIENVNKVSDLLNGTKEAMAVASHTTTAGVKNNAAALKGQTIATKKATTASKFLGLALKALPFFAIIAAATAVVGVVGRVIRAFGDSNRPVREFTRSLRESRDAFRELRTEMERNHTTTRSTATALLGLVAAGIECATQKELVRRKSIQFAKSHRGERLKSRWRRMLQQLGDYPIRSFFNLSNSFSSMAPSSKRALSFAS